MTTTLAGLWYALYCKLKRKRHCLEDIDNESRNSIWHFLQENWENCLKICQDAEVVQTVLAVAFKDRTPNKTQICSIALHLMRLRYPNEHCNRWSTEAKGFSCMQSVNLNLQHDKWRQRCVYRNYPTNLYSASGTVASFSKYSRHNCFSNVHRRNN